MGKMQEGSVEADLTMDAYEQLGTNTSSTKKQKRKKFKRLILKRLA